MRIVTGFLMFPLFCLVVIILTGVLVWIVVKRGNHTVQDYLESQEKQAGSPHETQDSSASANTRWARGELQSPSTPKPTARPVTICGSCGAENPAGESKCQSCGQPL
jgi:cytoskeletal protein RodZ